MTSAEIAGNTISENDWIVLAYRSGSGPTLGLVGRVDSISVTGDTEAVVYLDTVPDDETGESIIQPIHTDRIEVCHIVDGPLTDRDGHAHIAYP